MGCRDCSGASLLAAAGGEDVVCAYRCIFGSMDSIGGLSLCWLTADWSWFAEAVATRAVLGGLDLGGGLGGLGLVILLPQLEDLGSSPPGLLMVRGSMTAMSRFPSSAHGPPFYRSGAPPKRHCG